MADVEQRLKAMERRLAVLEKQQSGLNRLLANVRQFSVGADYLLTGDLLFCWGSNKSKVGKLDDEAVVTGRFRKAFAEEPFFLQAIRCDFPPQWDVTYENLTCRADGKGYDMILRRITGDVKALPWVDYLAIGKPAAARRRKATA